MAKKEKLPTHMGTVVTGYGWRSDKQERFDVRLFATPKRYKSERYGYTFSREGDKEGCSFALKSRGTYLSSYTYLLLDTVREITRAEHHEHFSIVLENKKAGVARAVETLNKAKDEVVRLELAFTLAEQVVEAAMEMVERFAPEEEGKP